MYATPHIHLHPDAIVQGDPIIYACVRAPARLACDRARSGGCVRSWASAGVRRRRQACPGGGGGGGT